MTLSVGAPARCLALAAALALPLFDVAAAPAVPGGEEACLQCHGKLVERKVVHGAVRIQCAACHDAIDASVTPHRVKGGLAKGMANQGAAQCLACHEKGLFEGKVVHAPVAAGMCLVCHDPHASDNPAMLKKAPAAQCLDCHPEVAKGPHVIAGFSRAGHPLGGEARKAGPPPEDPLRAGRPFYCASCHEPHRSELPRLNRLPKGMDSCRKCHKM